MLNFMYLVIMIKFFRSESDVILAVIAVNLVIGYYIFMAMKETPHQEPQPDPTFMAKAKASINQPTTSSQVSDDDSRGKGKVE